MYLAISIYCVAKFNSVIQCENTSKRYKKEIFQGQVDLYSI